MTIRPAALSLILILTMLSCGGDGGSDGTDSVDDQKDWTTSLQPSETFDWAGHPIQFAPPPPTWERQREQSGGLLGARFVKSHSVGERIHVAEVQAIGRRDRCAALAALSAEIRDLPAREFLGRLQRARAIVSNPIHEAELQAARLANLQLDDARRAYRAGDLDEAESRISTAAWRLRQIEYRLEDVLDQVIFESEDLAQFGDVSVFEPEPIQIGEREGIRVDYTLDSRERGRLYRGREVYLMDGNHLFVASFLGLAENLPLFDAIVETIDFPASPCEA